MNFPIYIRYSDTHYGMILSKSEVRWFLSGPKEWVKETGPATLIYYIQEAGKIYPFITKEEFEAITKPFSKPKDTKGW
jgi:hypothetical protein